MLTAKNFLIFGMTCIVQLHYWNYWKKSRLITSKLIILSSILRSTSENSVPMLLSVVNMAVEWSTQILSGVACQQWVPQTTSAVSVLRSNHSIWRLAGVLMLIKSFEESWELYGMPRECQWFLFLYGNSMLWCWSLGFSYYNAPLLML